MSSRHLLRPARRASLLGLALLAFSGSGCSDIRVREGSGDELSLVGRSTYAWLPEASGPEDGAEAWSQRQLAREIRQLADRHLGARGFRRVEAGEAELLVEHRTHLEVQVRERDPYFSFDTVRKVEVGKLSLHFSDAETRGELWSASAESDLREIARGFGITSIRYEPIEEPRDWKLEQKVHQIVSRLPERAPAPPN
ncbi:MAG: DUF4136 domain-containing protein [Planctomycetes bacterium]|nr:DUF4136 domain-containing protein [Planctomycetota bacterium]